jgi:uncharacterized protein DUF222
MGSITLMSAEEVAALGDGDLDEALVEMERARRLVEAAIVDVLDEADRRRRYVADGHVSVRGWAQALTNCSRGETMRRLQTMRALRDLESWRAALRAGDVGVDQVRELARVHANPRCAGQLPASEQALLAHAQRLDFEEFRIIVRRWESLADADGAHRDHELTHDRRNAHLVELDGCYHLEGHGGAVQGSAMQTIFERFCDAEFASDWAEVRERFGDAACAALMDRTDAQRRFDAVHAIFLAAASTSADERRPEPSVNVIVDHQTLEEHLAHAAGGPKTTPDPSSFERRRCETDTGVPLDPADVVAAVLIGQVRRVVFDSTGVVINLGRSRRVFTGGARDAVLLQHRRCLWPGCGLPARRSQIDHMNPWGPATRGTTDPANGTPLCGRHNRWKNRGYRTWRDPDGQWHLVRPDGTEMTTAIAATEDDAA